MSDIDNPIKSTSTTTSSILSDSSSGGIQSSAEMIAAINQFQSRFTNMDTKFIETGIIGAIFTQKCFEAELFHN